MSSGSPCAACKMQRRKCTPGCVFAPYFPPDQPSKFESVHRVFGASNVAKLLGDLPPAQRERAAESLVYEACARLNDPVYGCVRYITFLHHALRQVQMELHEAKRQVAAAFPHLLLQTPAPSFGMELGLAAASAEAPQQTHISTRHHHHQQMEQEMAMLRSYEQLDAKSFNGGLFKQIEMGDGTMGVLGSFHPTLSMQHDSMNLNHYP
ncbi:protein ASYMMETRIC LEAVES 2-like [Curcuma longa]|uniref:protein ASYMMETRIC LEAVES 2-like n=1 Tax=Curcuma longa TaxID=136217 RepID=UPI003D9EB22F